MTHDGPRPSQELAARIGEEVERALEAQTPAVRQALQVVLADRGATLRWEPNPKRPRRVVVLIDGRELVQIDLIRPLVN